MHKQAVNKQNKFKKLTFAWLFLLATVLYSPLLQARSENSSTPPSPSSPIVETLQLQQITFHAGEGDAAMAMAPGSRIEITTGEINSPETLALAQQWARQAFRTAIKADPSVQISALSVVDANATAEERQQALAETQASVPAEVGATVGNEIGQAQTPEELDQTINQLQIENSAGATPPSFYDRHYRKIFSFYRAVSVAGATTAAIVIGGNPRLGALLVGTMGGLMSGSLQYRSNVVRYYLGGYPLNRVLATLVPKWAPSLGVLPITDSDADTNSEPAPQASIFKKVGRWYALEVAYMTATAATATIVSRILEMPGIAPGDTSSAIAFSILSTSAISILSQGIPDLAIVKAHEAEIRSAPKYKHLGINRRTDLKTMVVSAITMGLGIANMCGVHGMKYGLATVGTLGAMYWYKVHLKIKKTQSCESALSSPDQPPTSFRSKFRKVSASIVRRLVPLATLLMSWI